MSITIVPQEPVSIRPVGVVISYFKKVSRNYDYNQESIIHMREDLSEALIGLEFFSHIHVIYYQHRKKDWLHLVGAGQEEKTASLTIQIGRAHV